jgi:hypothetical protein
MQVTIDIPEHLAARLEPERGHVAEIIERGLACEWSRTSKLAQEVMAFLARSPEPREIIAFHPCEESAHRVRELLRKNSEGSITPEEEAELDEMEAVNHLFTLVKARARRSLRSSP